MDGAERGNSVSDRQGAGSDLRRMTVHTQARRLRGPGTQPRRGGPMNRLSLLSAVAALAAATLPAAAHAQSFHIVEATIDDIQAQYRAGKLSPEQVVRMYLSRI